MCQSDIRYVVLENVLVSGLWLMTFVMFFETGFSVQWSSDDSPGSGLDRDQPIDKYIQRKETRKAR